MLLNVPEAYIEINLSLWQKVLDFSNVNWNINFWGKLNSVIIHNFIFQLLYDFCNYDHEMYISYNLSFLQYPCMIFGIQIIGIS